MQEIMQNVTAVDCDINSRLNQNFVDSSDNNDTIFYDLVGNFIPPEWRSLGNSEGKILSKTARQLLSLIVSCLKSADYSDGYGNSGELQEGYYFFERSLGLCQRRVRQCLLELEQSSFIDIKVRTIVKNYTRCRNILCIRLIRKFQCYKQNFSAEPEINCSLNRKDFQPLPIIDNNISNLKSRYSKSNFVDKFEEVNWADELQQNYHSEEKIKPRIKIQEACSNASNTDEICHRADLVEDKSANNKIPDDPPPSPSWIGKITNKAKSFRFSKKLEEFHPLTEEDGSFLRVASNRDFNLSFINKLLLKLSQNSPSNRFYSKKAALNYMSKALIHEMRQTSFVNNENFNFKLDDATMAKEQYLQKVEYSRNTDQYAQLRRKIASVFDASTAYNLLTSCRFAGITNDNYKLLLPYGTNLSEQVKKLLLAEIKGVYGNSVRELQITTINQKEKAKPIKTYKIPNNSYSQGYPGLSSIQPGSVWYKVRKYLLELYGEAIDKSWFSKLEVVEENTINKKILLKPSTSFIGNWISQNYAYAMQSAFKSQDFTFELVNA